MWERLGNLDRTGGSETPAMRLISWKRLRVFAEEHPHALGPLKVWRKLIQTRSFATPADVKEVFGSTVDFLRNDIVVFDIGGNKFRLAVNIRYRLGRVFVRDILTHDQYDRRTKKGTL
jgi:mRNA interferase HigB